VNCHDRKKKTRGPWKIMEEKGKSGIIEEARKIRNRGKDG